MVIKISTLNNKIRNCTKCRLYKTRDKAVCGEGPLNARIILIAQAPGVEEDKKGKMFIGPSGKVLDKLLEKAEVRRENLYMTNLLKCMLPDYRKPKMDEIETCSEYLDKEIELIEPQFLVPMGFYSTRYILQKYGIDIPDKKEFKKVYGKLFYQKDMKIYPVQHPAAVLYHSDLKPVLQKNFDKLKIFKHECRWYPVCPMKRFYEEGKIDKKWIELYCKGDWKSCVRYKMEKNGESHPDYMLPDGGIDGILKNKF